MIYVNLPAFNEEKGIGKLLRNIKKGMERRGYDYKILVYDDGSTDNTLNTVKDMSSEVPLEVLDGKVNKGLGTAMNALIHETITQSQEEEDIMVVLDSDCTHNPEHIYNMVNKIRDGFDVAIASRYLSDSRVVGVTRLRNFLSMGASWIMRLLFHIEGVRDYTCGYRAYRVTVLKEALDKYGDKLIEEKGFACMAELLIKLMKMNILAVEVPLVLRYDQKADDSKMDITKTIKTTLIMLLKLRLQ